MPETSLNDGGWYTCTPIRFVGDHTFFARDSGLLCKGFQEAGYQCKAIMPGPAMDVDNTEDLIRTDYSNLENPDWWRSLRAEGVVLYAWGDGRYWKIARAIKLSGAKLVCNMDTAGIMGILSGFRIFCHSVWNGSKIRYEFRLIALFNAAIRILYYSSIGLIRGDFRRAIHLNNADIIGVISPIAKQRIEKVCRIYGGRKLVSRIKLIPHPNSKYMHYCPDVPKERLVVAIGRWEDHIVKGTQLLAETLSILTKTDPDVCVEIYGRITPLLESWHAALGSSVSDRIKLPGIVTNKEIRNALQRARITLCTSSTESYHLVSAEALCCGCSIVGPDIEEIPSLKWFTDGPYGRLAKRDSTSLSVAIADELKDWDTENRDPEAISEHWSANFHASEVARRIISLTSQRRPTA